MKCLFLFQSDNSYENSIDGNDVSFVCNKFVQRSAKGCCLVVCCSTFLYPLVVTRNTVMGKPLEFEAGVCILQ